MSHQTDDTLLDLDSPPRNKHNNNNHNKNTTFAKSLLSFALSFVMRDDENIQFLLDPGVEQDGNDNFESISNLSTFSTNTKSCRGHFIDCILGNGFNTSNSKNASKPTKASLLKESKSETDIGNDNGNTNDNSYEKKSEYNYKKKNDPLSLRQIASNFNLLSQRLKIFTDLINWIVDVFNWKKNDKTLSVLFLYTWACINPHFFLLYPIIYFINYILHRYLVKHHIVEKPSMYTKTSQYQNYWDDGLGPRLKTTTSNSIHGLFGFLWDTDVENDVPYNENDYDFIRQVARNKNPTDEELEFKTVDDMLTFIEDTVNRDDNDNNLVNLNDNEKNKIDDDVVSNSYRNFILRSLYDIQIQTNQILDHIDNIQNGISESCDFIDEKESTILVFKLFLVVCIASILGAYIPWRAIFILSVWIGICMNHPKRENFINTIINPSQKVNKRNSSSSTSSYSKKKKSGQKVDPFSARNVIINEPVFAREVQIFELQQQSIMDPKKYVLLGYTTSVFNITNTSRLQKRKPLFVYNLSDVEPPVKSSELVHNTATNTKDKNSRNRIHLSWSYINGEDWRLSDTRWVNELKYSNELFIKHSNFTGDPDECWVYDITGEFRRRRWVRRIIQHV